MQFIENVFGLIFKILKFVVVKIFMMGGLFLLVGNIMWLFYNQIGKGITYFADKYATEHNYYMDFSGALDSKVFGDADMSKLFLNQCALGDAEAEGRYMIHMNKVCLSPKIDPKKISNMDKLTVYHEITHYKLRNLPIDKKLIMREKILNQVAKIKKALITIDTKKLEDDKTSDLDDKMFFHNLSGVNENSSQSVYKFYDITKDLIISHRGNEEYITYGVQYFLQVDKDTGKLSFEDYKLKNPLLAEIKDGYIDIYKSIGLIY